MATRKAEDRMTIEWKRTGAAGEYYGETDIENYRYMAFDIAPEDIEHIGKVYHLTAYGVAVNHDDPYLADDVWREGAKTFNRLKDAKEYANHLVRERTAWR